MPKITRERFKTMHNVFDEHTNRQIFDLMSKGLFEGLESPISIGKEANIFTALTKEKERVIVKIYRIMAADFKRMYQYICTDPRFKGIASSRRKVLFAWVQREYRNLLLARSAGVRIPTPLGVGTNVLVMEYIGDHAGVAPKLKDSLPLEPAKFLKLLLEEMRKLYQGGMVHGDLSPYNILNFHEEPVLIDFSATTATDDPMADPYLEKGLTNIHIYFKKLGVHSSVVEMKKHIVATSENKATK